MSLYCWPIVCDDGPPLKQHWVNVWSTQCYKSSYLSGAAWTECVCLRWLGCLDGRYSLYGRRVNPEGGGDRPRGGLHLGSVSVSEGWSLHCVPAALTASPPPPALLLLLLLPCVLSFCLLACCVRIGRPVLSSCPRLPSQLSMCVSGQASRPARQQPLAIDEL